MFRGFFCMSCRRTQKFLFFFDNFMPVSQKKLLQVPTNSRKEKSIVDLLQFLLTLI